MANLNHAVTLAEELQKRLRGLPEVKAFPFHLESQPSDIVPVLMVKPRSWAEISRVVRAARTMKLQVRACGDCTGGEHVFYGGSGGNLIQCVFETTPCVMVDCRHLTDSPRIEITQVRRKGELGEQPGLRVLAGVSIAELIEFQVCNQIELFQSTDLSNMAGTVVGAVISGGPGMVLQPNKVAPDSPAAYTGQFGGGIGDGPAGACLADEVISLRVVNCHGELIEYSSLAEVTNASASLGLLGIVYDITLRYRPMTISHVKYSFHSLADLMDTSNIKLVNSISVNHITQLIYLPYNSSVKTDDPCVDRAAAFKNDGTDDSAANGKPSVQLSQWNPLKDEVIMRSCRIVTDTVLSQDPSELSEMEFHDNSYMPYSIPAIDQQLPHHDSVDGGSLASTAVANYPESPITDPYQRINVIDEVFGPDIDRFVKSPQSTPSLLAQAYMNLARVLKLKPHLRQFTPWAINALAAPIEKPTRCLRFTVAMTRSDMSNLWKALTVIVDCLKIMATDTSNYQTPNFSMNLGLYVNFTGGTRAARILGLGVASQPTEDGFAGHDSNMLLAHIKLMGINAPRPRIAWKRAAQLISTKLFEASKAVVPQWRSEWHFASHIFEIYRKMVNEEMGELKKLVAQADRDGVFLNNDLAAIFYPKLTNYQENYGKERKLLMSQF